MVLLSLARRLMLIRLRSDANYKMMKIMERLRGLSRYAANIADGLISMKESHDIPTDLFMRQSQFQYAAHTMAYNTASQQMQMMMPMMQMNLQSVPPEMQQQYLNNQFMAFYQEGRKQAAQEEQRVLHEQEKELEEEKEKLKVLIAEYDGEIESLNKNSKEEIRQFYA